MEDYKNANFDNDSFDNSKSNIFKKYEDFYNERNSEYLEDSKFNNYTYSHNENIDYEKLSLEEILNTYKVQIFSQDETTPMWDQVVINNKYFKLYLAKNSKIQNCSLMVLNDVHKRKKLFGELLENLSRLDKLNSNFILKLKGANVFPNKVYFLFDLVLTNYAAKKKQIENNINFKFSVLFYLIEMLSVLHSEFIMLEDLRFSLIMLDNMDELKFLIPFRIKNLSYLLTNIFTTTILFYYKILIV